MRELFANPVTTIAIGLAVFFILMAMLRRWTHRQAERARAGLDEKPYTVSDPYTPPAEAAVPLAEPPPEPKITVPTQKVFRQFGTAHAGPDEDGSEYVWE